VSTDSNIVTDLNESSKTARLAALGSAAAGIAHDINNELTLILNYLALCERTTPHMDALRDATRRCAHLTTDMMNYCRGESVVLRDIDAQDFLIEFVEEIKLPPTASLTLDMPEPANRLQADPRALQRILRNLIENARDAILDQGWIRISVRGRSVTVTDSGNGIPAAQRASIFEPFFSTKKRARDRKGNGLGLSIVRDLMTQQGGTVALISEPGQGASFQLRFKA
jgi:signal transduction histidine kinase